MPQTKETEAPETKPRRCVVKLEVFDNGDGKFDICADNEKCGTYDSASQAATWASGEITERMRDIYGEIKEVW